MPLSMNNKPMVDKKMDAELERKLIGNETVDGHPAKKILDYV